jgi:hypothetical protein
MALAAALMAIGLRANVLAARAAAVPAAAPSK